MKKIVMTMVATAAMLLAGTSSASAQETGFSWGPKVGMNVSSMSDGVKDTKAKVGFTAGVFGEYRTCNWFAVSAEVLYSRQGASSEKYTSEYDNIEYHYKEKTDYINVPLLANFYITEKLALKTGLQFGFCIGAKSDDGHDSNDSRDYYNGVDIAIPIGISYDLGPIVVDARYNFGITDAYRSCVESYSKNNVFQFSVGYRF